MKLDEFGVGKITAQNTTKDVKPGETERQAKKLGLVNGKPKLLHKTAAKNSDPNTLFNLGITEDYAKDMDEKWFKNNISKIAKKYNIDPDIALKVWQSEGGMKWQSQLKPKTKKVKTAGGREASYGPFQLYTGKGGLGNAWEEKYGKKLSTANSPEDVLSQIDFALSTVPNRGWQDFKGAERVGIKQNQGVNMYKDLPKPKPTDLKNKSMYKKLDKVQTQPSVLDPRPIIKKIPDLVNPLPLAKTLKKQGQDFYQQSKKELDNISVDKDSFTYKNVVKPAGKAYDYISKGFTGFMKDLKKSPEYKAAGEKNKKLYGPKNAVKETELVTELVSSVGSPEHLINRVNKVADICATMGDRPLLYRMLRGTSTGGRYSLIQKVTPRGIRDEKLLGSGNAVQPHVLNKLGIEHPVFATMDPHPGTSGKFGANFFMVPIGAYKIYSSPQVKDLGSDISYMDKGRKMFAPASDEEVAKFDAVADTYKEGWPSAGFPNEVILDCEQYYMINVGEFVKKYAGEKARQMYTRDTDQFSKIKNDINKELLTSRFKTYNDMAWYLRNPVTNLLTITTKQESIKELKIQKPDPKTTLGIKRKDMPQIKKKDYEEFIEYLQNNGAKFRKETVPASELKAMQSEFSDKGIIKQIEKNLDQGINTKAIIVSEDDYVLDGHHRWLVASNTGNDLDIYRINMPAYELYDLVKGFEKTYYKDMYDETRGSIGVPLSSGLVVSIFPHRPLKIKKPTKGKLNYNEDLNTQRGRLEYFLKQPSISQGRAIHLGKLPKYHDGDDELAKLVPERNGVYALHPDAWESTFYSLTNKDLKKITRYQPAIVKIPEGSIVADMAIANQFYRTKDPVEKEKFAKAYKDSIVPYGSDISHIKMPEIIMPRLVESKMKGGSDFYKFMGYKLKDLDPDNIRQLPKVLKIDPAVAKPKLKPKVDPEDFEEQIDEDLRDWFKQKWVNIGKKKKGGGHPECGTSGDKRGYAKCVPAAKAAKMTKKEKESAVRRKRAAQNKKGRGGKKKAGSGKKPIRVSTKAKK